MTGEIEIGTKVGWSSDSVYGSNLYAEGVVVFRERDNLVILREDIVAKHPHINPFALRKVHHVWIVMENENEEKDAA